MILQNVICHRNPFVGLSVILQWKYVLNDSKLCYDRLLALSCPKNLGAQSDLVLFCAPDNET